ncbi:MAG TPA: hypothetical protein PKM59_10340 [Thermodesulfobacteriota bacterium]|nr:hypothetical protein [Thermodesulfobacteriota bacterium]HNU72076.1 hypothetical protein [Thermodesulfobacteriota bacterium]
MARPAQKTLTVSGTENNARFFEKKLKRELETAVAASGEEEHKRAKHLLERRLLPSLIMNVSFAYCSCYLILQGEPVLSAATRIIALNSAKILVRILQNKVENSAIKMQCGTT